MIGGGQKKEIVNPIQARYQLRYGPFYEGERESALRSSEFKRFFIGFNWPAISLGLSTVPEPAPCRN
jgi:hypothetical protein